MSTLESLMRRCLALLAVSLVACTNDTPRTSTALVRDSAGVRIVESHAPQWDDVTAWRLGGAPLIDIGGETGDPDSELYRVVGALRLEDGRIVIANSGSHQLRFYDPSGGYLGSAGGRGDGPGEFQGMRWVARYGADSLVVYDSRHRRLSFFDFRGRFGGSLTLRAPYDSGDRSITVVSSAYSAVPLGVFATGAYLASVTHRFSDLPTEGLVRPEVHLLFYDASGEFADTLGVFPGTELSVNSIVRGRTVSVLLFPPHFGRSTTFLAHGNEFFVAVGDHYEVMVYGLDGRLRSLIRRDHKLLPVTQSELDELLRMRLTDVDDDKSRRDMRRRFTSTASSESIPAVASIKIDDLGNIWVEEYDWPHTGQPRWTVFDRNGQLLGTLQLPSSFTPYHIGADFILGRWEDELDVEHVQLFRIVKP